MAGQIRLATFSATTSYQNINVLIAAMSGHPFGDVRQFVEGYFRVTENATFPIRISVASPGATTGSDSTSNLIAVGEYLPFDYTDLQLIWIKAVGGASTLEFSAPEAPGTS